MNIRSHIDITFDFRLDTPEGKDPDAHSPTLRRYHKLLWSKPLPNGVVFTLDDTTPRVYLHHRSEKGEYFWLYNRRHDALPGKPDRQEDDDKRCAWISPPHQGPV